MLYFNSEVWKSLSLNVSMVGFILSVTTYLFSSWYSIAFCRHTYDEMYNYESRERSSSDISFEGELAAEWDSRRILIL